MCIVEFMCRNMLNFPVQNNVTFALIWLTAKGGKQSKSV